MATCFYLPDDRQHPTGGKTASDRSKNNQTVEKMNSYRPWVTAPSVHTATIIVESISKPICNF
ncbi:hypothetical protein [Aeromonas sp. QDB34]|uniref:hypothetical protein n=1 Tax=Aeromonas sp. QDB34 TaxID=2990489 RepID=UPI0022DEA377|nr:hypothetical protein [Aeromonas sp. QDB34]